MKAEICKENICENEYRCARVTLCYQDSVLGVRQGDWTRDKIRDLSRSEEDCRRVLLEKLSTDLSLPDPVDIVAYFSRHDFSLSF